MLQLILTPAEQHVQINGAGVGEQSQEDEIMEVKSLHKDPGVVGHDAVLPYSRHCLAQQIVL